LVDGAVGIRAHRRVGRYSATVEESMLKSAVKDGQHVTADWMSVQVSIDGVSIHEVRHVPRDHGIITEVYRPEWDPTALPVVQVYQSRLYPGAIGAWSCHASQFDRLFINQGNIKLVLFDGREDGPTFGRLTQHHVGDARPCFVVVPPGVWHGLQNVGSTDALMLNLPSVAYRYDDPDHFRLPFDSPEIPYRWGQMDTGARLRADANR
jgi:dTDP-4-dehydrorhamnose 3,5-epimerase